MNRGRYPSPATNRDRIRSFLAKWAPASSDGGRVKQRRAKRRRGAWADLLGRDRQASGRGPH
jgi:hypothetical protein